MTRTLVTLAGTVNVPDDVKVWTLPKAKPPIPASVAQVPSPRRKVEPSAVPLPNRAAATLPEVRLPASRLVTAEPFTAGR